ncbi:MAG: MarR family winged helix-turn-helix transcriptional regulator [Candidatus Binatia bacterium]
MNPTGKRAAPDYQALAELRYRVRRFLRFSEQAARAAGLEPQQHQLLLALKGLPDQHKHTISALAERLQVEHHSTVELIDRLEERGLVRRARDKVDRRQVLVRITPKGEDILQDLSLHHLDELQSIGPDLMRVLTRLLSRFSSGERKLRAVNDK